MASTFWIHLKSLSLSVLLKYLYIYSKKLIAIISKSGVKYSNSEDFAHDKNQLIVNNWKKYDRNSICLLKNLISQIFVIYIQINTNIMIVSSKVCSDWLVIQPLNDQICNLKFVKKPHILDSGLIIENKKILFTQK